MLLVYRESSGTERQVREAVEFFDANTVRKVWHGFTYRLGVIRTTPEKGFELLHRTT
jgi:hypothetical protein